MMLSFIESAAGTPSHAVAQEQRDVEVPLVLNPGAGRRPAENGGTALEETFRAAGIAVRRITVTPGMNLTAMAATLARENPRVIIAAGGDGTINAVASALAGTGITLGVLPLGTLNHFARDLGIPLDPAAAARTIAAGYAVEVDVGEVNGRVFLNNSSLGLYPHIVRQREQQQRRLGRGKWSALFWATLRTLRRRPFLSVRLETEQAERQCMTSFVFIGNNEYTMEGFNIGQRERLDGGRLSLYLTRRCTRARLVMLALRALIGRLHQAKDFEALNARSIVVDTPHRQVHVALDGEVTVLETPLEYTIRPRALRVLVPQASRSS